jgi:hypothetical protein
VGNVKEVEEDVVHGEVVSTSWGTLKWGGERVNG